MAKKKVKINRAPVLTLWAAVVAFSNPGPAFQGTLTVDGFATFFRATFFLRGLDRIPDLLVGGFARPVVPGPVVPSSGPACATSSR